VSSNKDNAVDSASTGVLYVVATPIGNMGDITLRAIDVLRGVPLVAAEDTRMARRLWARHEIATRLISYHAQSPQARQQQLIEHLANGYDLALITDAGTPLVSDPGGELVTQWTQRGGRVIPIPGASAVLAALVASGLPAARWTFEGFLARRGRERRELIERIANDERTSILFESPGRAGATLAELATKCGPDRPAALCRELTKLHEEIWRGSLAQLAERANDQAPRGEVTIVVSGVSLSQANETPKIGIAEGRSKVDRLVEEGYSRSQAARQVAESTGLPRRDLFRK
jgi:16S rRNA (cytidine1402-2'-O)-methyltransferase